MSKKTGNPKFLEKMPCGHKFKHRRNRIDDIKELNTAHHVCFKRKYHEHHGIVCNVSPEEGIFWVVEVLGVSIRDKLNGNSTARVSVKKHDFSSEKGTVYVLEYAEGECFPPSKVLELAYSLVGKQYVKYNLFTKNCEHYASAIKTGTGISEQIECFAGRSCSMSKSSANSVIFEINLLDDQAVEGTSCCKSDKYKCEEMDENANIAEEVFENVPSPTRKRKGKSEPEESRLRLRKKSK